MASQRPAHPRTREPPAPPCPGLRAEDCVPRTACRGLRAEERRGEEPASYRCTLWGTQEGPDDLGASSSADRRSGSRPRPRVLGEAPVTSAGASSPSIPAASTPLIRCQVRGRPAGRGHVETRRAMTRSPTRTVADTTDEGERGTSARRAGAALLEAADRRRGSDRLRGRPFQSLGCTNDRDADRQVRWGR
jgi:hypothetical protein